MVRLNTDPSLNASQQKTKQLSEWTQYPTQSSRLMPFKTCPSAPFVRNVTALEKSEITVDKS